MELIAHSHTVQMCRAVVGRARTGRRGTDYGEFSQLHSASTRSYVYGVTPQGLAMYLRRLQSLSDFSWAIVSTTMTANVVAALICLAQEQRDTVRRG